MHIVTKRTLIMPKMMTSDFEGLCDNAACGGNMFECELCVFGNMENYEYARKFVNSDMEMEED